MYRLEYNEQQGQFHICKDSSEKTSPNTFGWETVTVHKEESDLHEFTKKIMNDDFFVDGSFNLSFEDVFNKWHAYIEDAYLESDLNAEIKVNAVLLTGQFKLTDYEALKISIEMARNSILFRALIIQGEGSSINNIAKALGLKKS